VFKDSKNRKFEGVIVLPTVVRLKALGVDLGGDLPVMLQQLQADPELLGNVLYLVHEASAKELDVSDQDFGYLLNGDTLAAAFDSLVDAIINFSQPAMRPAMRKLVEKGNEVTRIHMERLETEVNKLDPEAVAAEMVAKMDQKTQAEPVAHKTEELTSSKSAGSSRELLGSPYEDIPVSTFQSRSAKSSGLRVRDDETNGND
jgi:hypothetical protein